VTKGPNARRCFEYYPYPVWARRCEYSRRRNGGCVGVGKPIGHRLNIVVVLDGKSDVPRHNTSQLPTISRISAPINSSTAARYTGAPIPRGTSSLLTDNFSFTELLTNKRQETRVMENVISAEAPLASGSQFKSSPTKPQLQLHSQLREFSSSLASSTVMALNPTLGPCLPI
jgi:hypothetical protein